MDEHMAHRRSASALNPGIILQALLQAHDASATPHPGNTRGNDVATGMKNASARSTDKALKPSMAGDGNVLSATQES
jgi:hypothetical protein